MPEIVLVIPQKQKGSKKRATKLAVLQKEKFSWQQIVQATSNSDKKGLFEVIYQLLMRSGDVETNPGPGNHACVVMLY